MQSSSAKASRPAHRCSALPRANPCKPRGARNSNRTRKGEYRRRAVSPMLGSFDVIEKCSNVILRGAGLRPPEVTRLYREGQKPLRAPALRQRSAQMIVDDRLERSTGATRLRAQAGGDIVFEGKGGAHIMMSTLVHPIPPRKYVERGYNVTRWSEFLTGGHFAAMEEPEALAEDIRAFTRQFRGATR